MNSDTTTNVFKPNQIQPGIQFKIAISIGEAGIHEYHGEKRGDLYFTKDMLLAVGDHYEADIARNRAIDAPYR